MDKASVKILDMLQGNARCTTSDLAESAGLSASPSWRRVKDMEEEGVIRGYVALLDAPSIGLTVNVLISVRLEKQTTENLARFQDEISLLPEIMECYLMSGDADYLLRAVFPNLAEYRHFLLEHLTRIPGIANIKSSFALDQIKYTTALPLGHLGSR